MQRLRERWREHGDAREGRDLSRAVVAQGWGLLELRPMRMSLEEIFLSLTTDDVAAVAGSDAAPATTPEGDAVNA